jgi:hypothetical protein
VLFLAEHVPGLERLTQLELRDAQHLIAELRKAELEMRREPLETQGKARALCSSITAEKSCQMKCGSMKRSCSCVPQRASRAGA